MHFHSGIVASTQGEHCCREARRFSATKEAEARAAFASSQGNPAGQKITAAERKSGVEQIVGSVNESRQAHLERCQQPGCPRCRWYLVGHMWQATYGSLEEVEAGPMG